MTIDQNTLRNWAEKRADDAGMLARELVKTLAALETTKAALRRCRTVLGNMALENEGAIINRWPISHEPLRADARGLLPVIDAALEGKAKP